MNRQLPCNFKKRTTLKGRSMPFEGKQPTFIGCMKKQLNEPCDGQKNCIDYQAYKRMMKK